MATLSEQERADILAAAWDQADPDWDAMLREVEAILTARLAKVEALADDFHERAQNFVNETDVARACRAGWLGAARDLRAALTSDPTHTQDGGRR